MLHAYESGLSRAADRQILEHARRDRRTVVTLDADFHALLAVENAGGPSVIRIRREGLTGADLAGLLVQLWPTVELASLSLRSSISGYTSIPFSLCHGP